MVCVCVSVAHERLIRTPFINLLYADPSLTGLASTHAFLFGNGLWILEPGLTTEGGCELWPIGVWKSRIYVCVSD